MWGGGAIPVGVHGLMFHLDDARESQANAEAQENVANIRADVIERLEPQLLRLEHLVTEARRALHAGDAITALGLLAVAEIAPINFEDITLRELVGK